MAKELRAELEEIEYNPVLGVRDVIGRLDRVFWKLEREGFPMIDDHRIGTLMRALPEHARGVAYQIWGQHGCRLTYAELCKQLLPHEFPGNLGESESDPEDIEEDPEILEYFESEEGSESETDTESEAASEEDPAEEEDPEMIEEEDPAEEEDPEAIEEEDPEMIEEEDPEMIEEEDPVMIEDEPEMIEDVPENDPEMMEMIAMIEGELEVEDPEMIEEVPEIVLDEIMDVDMDPAFDPEELIDIEGVDSDADEEMDESVIDTEEVFEDPPSETLSPPKDDLVKTMKLGLVLTTTMVSFFVGAVTSYLVTK